MWQRTCENCGSPFEAKREWRRFCGVNCTANAAYHRKKTNAPPIKKECVSCGTIFNISQHFRSFCSNECRLKVRRRYADQAHKAAYATGQLPGTPATKGTIAELFVANDLFIQGWHVFRALSAHCPCDLIAMKDSKLLRIEVRLGRRIEVTGISYPRKDRDIGRYDVLAVYTSNTNECIYQPPLPEL